ncbi:DNA-directed DNA polymerase [Aeromonas phage avDM6]|nr:DNA-directed DNA polymerase [Aeromonas phage avDM6]
MNFYTNVWMDGNTIYDRYFDSNGNDKIRKVRYSPTLYRHVGNHIETKFKDIYDRKCLPKTLESIGEARKWFKEMQSMDKEVLGMDNYTFQYISDTYGANAQYDYSMLDIMFLDIEVPTDGPFPDTTNCAYEIDTIQIYSTKMNKYFIWTTREWDCNKSILDKEVLDHVEYHHNGSEKEILIRFLQFFTENTPHYVSGWNSEGFDIPYIARRIKKILGDKFLNKLSPFGTVNEIITKDDNDDEVITYDITGVNCIDFMAAYKKFTFTTRPNYKLDTIAEAELGINKVEMTHRTYLDFATKDPQTYIDYSIRDVEIIKNLEIRLSLIYLIASVSYYAGVNAADVFSPLKTWDAIIYNSLLEQGIIIPENKHAQRAKFAGAYVKDPIPGMYQWLLSFDLTSLYPHIIMGTNISPETLVDQIDIPRILVKDRMVPDIDGVGLVNGTYNVPHEGKYSFAANGVRYRTDMRGFLPIEVEKVFKQRKAAKTDEFRADALATRAAKILAMRHHKE